MSGHTERKLLTKAEWKRLLAPYGAEEAVQYLGERGLIAPEPVDAMLLEARRLVECTVQWSAQTDRDLQSGKNDSAPEVKIAIASLRRGREIGLAERYTRERVRDAAISASEYGAATELYVTRLHAALTDGEVGNGC